MAEANDRFGTTLLAGAGGLLVGAPLENVGSAVNAGAITELEMKCVARFGSCGVPVP